jgi:hypothetical protein
MQECSWKPKSENAMQSKPGGSLMGKGSFGMGFGWQHTCQAGAAGCWLGNAHAISTVFRNVCNHSDIFGNQGVSWFFDAK